MRGVDTVFHLAGNEGRGGRADLLEVDVHGSRNLAEAAVDARIKRIFYVSHLDADRGSGYPLLKAKGIAEEYIRRSGIPHTILRSSVVFGLGDGFTTALALLLTAAPGFLPLPVHGRTLLQPLWVEDLITCLVWALDEPETMNQTYEVGGGEYFTLRQVVETIMHTIKKPRLLFSMPVPYLRALTVINETIFPRFPISVFWMDYLAANRTCPVDTVSRVFGLMPARFTTRLGYLSGIHWRRELFKRLFVPHA
jgi:NADH dehydrogenase